MPIVSSKKSGNHRKRLYLHIGIPKTASTWLQTDVFSRLNHLHYLDCSTNEMFQGIKDLSANQRSLGHVFNRSINIWEEFGDLIFEDLIGNRQSWLEKDLDLLISDERIGRWGSRPALLAAHFNVMKQKAANWGFDQIQLICVIRRQDHWLASHYAQMSDRKPNAGQEDFEKLIRDITSPHRLRYSFGMLLDYNELYRRLSGTIEKSNLLILPYEELKHSPATFVKSLLEKLETPYQTIERILSETSGNRANVRSEQGVWRLRKKKKRFAGIPLPEWNFNNNNKTIKLMPELSRQVFKSYSPGNKNLALKTDLKLGTYGYFGLESN